YDPVLLVGPAVALLLFALALVKGRLSRDSKLSRWVAVLMVIMVLQIFNPLQGGLAVGLAGALFYLVPLLWFWIGQSWGSAIFTEKVLFRVVIPVAVAGSLLGLYQAFFGLLSY